MPYKNIEDRREAYKRWTRKHPDQHKTRTAIQKLAVYYNPIVEVCGISGCEEKGERHHPDYSEPKKIIWLCKNHHEALHHEVARLCSVKDCSRKHWAKGFCLRHLKLSNPKKYMHPERYKKSLPPATTKERKKC